MIDKDTGEELNGNDVPKMGTFLRTAYNYDMDAASERTGLSCPEPTMTKQEFREETDINTIVKNFGLTGQMPTDVRMPMQEDFIEATDYHTALNTIIEAQHNFMRLPADVRTRFQNDPGQLLAFLENPANREEGEKLGLVKAGLMPTKTPEAKEAPAKDTAKEGGVT